MTLMTLVTLSPAASPTPTTIPQLLVAQAETLGSRTALTAADGTAVSYAELAASVDRLVTTLEARGVGRSSRLAVVLPNGFDVAVGLLAASSAAVAVPLPPQAQADEYRVWFRAGRVTHLLSCAQAAPAARHVAATLRLPLIELEPTLAGPSATAADWNQWGGSPRRWARLRACHEQRDKHDLPRSSAEPRAAARPAAAHDVAVVLMTSGSTGIPKRVPLTHANLLAGAASVADSLDLGPADRVLVMWEQYHVGGLVDLLLAPLVSGGTACLAGSFDAGRFFELLETHRPTWFQGVPTTLRELVVHAGLAGRLAGRLTAGGTLRFLRSVAAPLPPALMRDLEAAFGVPVIQTFGMTEAAPLITTNRLPPGIRKPGSTGTPAGCAVAVLDAAGELLPVGTPGEVAVRGPNLFAGYEDDPETNARSFRGGWFLTGDVGRFDSDGFLFLTGRVKEMINRGGEKIAPAEVEEVAVRHPAVAEAAAFAIPHPTLGEDVGLAVVPHEATPIDRAAIRNHIAGQLSRFKVPAVVLVLDTLPRCPIGKIRRRELAELAAAHVASRPPVPLGTEPADDLLVAGLADLWALHLDLPTVGPDDDFEILGGDSLSRIRLVLAVESLCGVRFPEAVAASVSTVRTMAVAIHRLGGRIPAAVFAEPDTGTATPAAVHWGDGDAAALADLPTAAIRRRLAGSRAMLELEAAREAILNTLTLDELAAVAAEPFTSSLLAWAGRLAPVLPRFSEPWRIATALAAWRSELLSAAATPSRPRWQRHPLTPAAIHYSREADPAAGRRLVIGFAGNHQRLMLPTHVLLDHLPAGDDLLLVSDPDRHHYAGGIRGIAPSLPDVCTWIACRLADWRYREIITFGTSAGGLAAIYTGLALRCPRAVAIGADTPAAHPPLEQLLLDRLAETPADQQPAFLLAYDPGNRRDRAGYEAVAGILPSSRPLTLDAAGGHNVLRAALTVGQLASLLCDLLDTDPGTDHGQRTAA